MNEMAQKLMDTAMLPAPINPGPNSVEEGHENVDLLTAFRTVQRGIRTILFVSTAATALSILTAFVLPVKYSSSASFIAPTNTANNAAAAIAGQLSSLGASGLMGGAKSSADLYAGILSSRSIGDTLVSRFDLKSVYHVKRQVDAVKRLRSNTTIEVETKSPIVTISVRDATATRAQGIANAYLDALRDANGRLALTESSQRRLFFGQQLSKEKDALADAEVDLKRTEERSGLIAPVGQATIGIETIAETKAQIAAREVELAALRQSSTDQNSAVIRLQSEISDLGRQLARQQDGNRDTEPGTIPASRVPQLQLEFVRRQRDVKYHEALFEMLAKQYEAARLDESRDAPSLQILDGASFPEQRSFPPRLLIIAGGVLLGGIMGCAWVLAREHLQPISSLFISGRSVPVGGHR